MDRVPTPCTCGDGSLDGGAQGADIDLMTDAFTCIGVPFKLNTGAFAGLITSVTEGRNDVMWDSLVYTPPRAKQVDFVMYETAGTGFVVRKATRSK